MMTRRQLLRLAAGLPLMATAASAQQPGQTRRVGFLLAESTTAQASRLEALRAGLRDLGYVEGKNIRIELRSADGNYDRLPALAAELVNLRVDALVAFGGKAVVAARSATSTIPIVIPSTGNPMESGLTESFSSPTSNVVGSDNLSREVYGKRLEVLKEIQPRIGRVAFLANPLQTTSGAPRATAEAAKSAKVELHRFEVRDPADFRDAFAAMAKARVDALLVQQDTLFMAYGRQLAQAAIEQRLPSAGTREYAEAGGLIGYGTIDAELYRRAAYFVDRLLKGAKPADMPIERASRFELIINRKTATAIGIRVPQSVLLRADKVIE
jgi:putative tryptophan/tyrosine transport system substrate-binding protein